MDSSTQNQTGEAPGNASTPKVATGPSLEEQLKDRESKYLYLYADFENAKKRWIRERSDLQKFGWEGAARDLVEVLDNLERALGHSGHSPMKAGLEMVIGQFRAALARHGITPVECADKDFDPAFHEAIAQEPSSAPAGKVLREEQKGYLLHGRLLRAARVVVSGGPEVDSGARSSHLGS